MTVVYGYYTYTYGWGWLTMHFDSNGRSQDILSLHLCSEHQNQVWHDYRSWLFRSKCFKSQEGNITARCSERYESLPCSLSTRVFNFRPLYYMFRFVEGNDCLLEVKSVSDDGASLDQALLIMVGQWGDEASARKLPLLLTTQWSDQAQHRLRTVMWH